MWGLGEGGGATTLSQTSDQFEVWGGEGAVITPTLLLPNPQTKPIELPRFHRFDIPV